MKNTVAIAGLVCALVIPAAAQEEKKEQTQIAPSEPAQTAPVLEQKVEQPQAVVSPQPQAQPSIVQPQEAPRLKSVKAEKSKTNGIVQMVDAASKKLTLKTNKGVVKEITLKDGATLTKGGNRKTITLVEVKEGDRVDIRMEGESVTTIHVQVKAK